MVKRSKYGNKKVTRDGITFDSMKEARRYAELMLLQRGGVIQGLQRQVKFELIPSQYDETPTGKFYTRGERKGQEKMERRMAENAVNYVADFVYYENGKKVVEDVKSSATEKDATFIIKRKLMLWVHGIKIKIT
jgi:hypothetical protein